MATKNPNSDLASHPALSADILPPVTKPAIPITTPPVPSGPNASLQWLLDINKQFFQWELKQIVSTPFVLSLHQQTLMYLSIVQQRVIDQYASAISGIKPLGNDSF